MKNVNIFLLDTIANKFFQDYIDFFIFLFKSNNFNVNFIKINYDIQPPKADINIFFPCHLIFIYRHKLFNFIKNFNITNNYIFNFEQLSREKFHKITRFMGRRMKIIDYSIGNNFIYNKSIVIPFLYYKNYPNIIKNKNICMIGVNTPRRTQLFTNLLQIDKTTTNIIGFGNHRDNQVLNYKILVNCHATDDFKIIEEIRINQFVINKLIVITENSINQNKYLLKDHVIFTNYDNFIDTVKDVINNYDLYYKKLFNNFDINNIISYQNNLINIHFKI